MSQRLLRYLVVCAIALAGFHAAQAQVVIKRASCADLPFDVFRNYSGVDQLVTVQVVRSGCRPKEGNFFVDNGGTGFGMLFNDAKKRTTVALKIPLPSGSDLSMGYQTVVLGPVRGSFDYYVTSD